MHWDTVAVDVVALCCCSVTAQTPAPCQQRVWLVGGTKRFAAAASAVASADCTAVTLAQMTVGARLQAHQRASRNKGQQPFAAELTPVTVKGV
jgi:hypothetical protein